MFDPKQITSSMLGYAPQFVLARFSSVIMGVIVAYGVLLFFLGQPPFFQRVGELGLVMTACYWSARGVRYAMTRVLVLIEGPDAATVAAAAGSAAPPAAASQPSIGSGAPIKKNSTQQPSSAASTRAGEKGGKGLD